MVPIPAPYIFGALSLLQSKARSEVKIQESNNRAMARLAEAELAKTQANNQHVENMARAEIEAERLRLEAQQAAQLQADQKEVLLRMIEAAENVHQLKLDKIMETFHSAKEMLQQHQLALVQEKSQMAASMTSAEKVSNQRYVLIMDRQMAVDSQLAEIDMRMGELSAMCFDVLSNTQHDLPVERMKLLAAELG